MHLRGADALRQPANLSGGDDSPISVDRDDKHGSTVGVFAGLVWATGVVALAKQCLVHPVEKNDAHADFVAEGKGAAVLTLGDAAGGDGVPHDNVVVALLVDA